MARVTNGCEALSFKNVVDSAARMTMRLGLFSRSQHLDLAGYRMQCGTARQAALWKRK
jgi:hypothetical protein